MAINFPTLPKSILPAGGQTLTEEANRTKAVTRVGKIPPPPTPTPTNPPPLPGTSTVLPKPIVPKEVDRFPGKSIVTVLPRPQVPKETGIGMTEQRAEAIDRAANPRQLPEPTVADLQRQQVRADASKAEQARVEAIKRQLGAQGISDAGIQGARIRGAEQDIRQAAGQQLTGINIGELEQQRLSGEAEKERQFIGEQADLGRDVQREGLGVQKELGLGQIGAALSGQEIQKELGLGQIGATLSGQEAQKEIANAQIEATRRGQDIQQVLAERGFDIDERGQLVQRNIVHRQLESQEAIAANREATTLRGQDLEADLFGDKITSDVQKAIIVSAMENLDLTKAEDVELFGQILTSLEINATPGGPLPGREEKKTPAEEFIEKTEGRFTGF